MIPRTSLSATLWCPTGLQGCLRPARPLLPGYAPSLTYWLLNPCVALTTCLQHTLNCVKLMLFLPRTPEATLQTPPLKAPRGCGAKASPSPGVPQSQSSGFFPHYRPCSAKPTNQNWGSHLRFLCASMVPLTTS